MALHEALMRLRDAAQQHPTDHRHYGNGYGRLVQQRDLVEVLRAFDRLDDEARMMYPPHVAMLRDVIGRLQPVLGDLNVALERMRPAS